MRSWLLRSHHRLGIDQSGQGLLSLGGQEQALQVAAKSFTLVTLPEQIVAKGVLKRLHYHHAVRSGQPGLFITTVELMEIINESIGASIHAGQGFVETQEDQARGGKLLRLATTVQWLVLDDLG